MEIEPYLEEYFYDNLDKIKNFRWSEIDKKLLN
jgi:5-methylcytosine-specific restriction protein B